MIAGAERRAQELGLSNIDFRVADMCALPDGDETFDRAICRFGLMFVPEPQRATAEVYRVLKPGGQAAFLVWGLRSGGRCDFYYSHPNGSLGQMVLEVAAFAALGLSGLRLPTGRGWFRLCGAVFAWHALHVGTFYAWLRFYEPWLWLHSVAVAATLLLAALGLRRMLRSRARPGRTTAP